MKRLLKGIAHFHKYVRPNVRETFAKLALGQKPDCLLVACSDSRVVPNLFASSDPGDMFVVRNPGNIVAPSDADGKSQADESEAGAIEFAVMHLGVPDIVVCGHSECGAMRALCGEVHLGNAEHLQAWLRHAEAALLARPDAHLDSQQARHNLVSQINVLVQLDNLRSYPFVAEHERQGKLRLHAWWFDIANAEVHVFDARTGRFQVIDETRAEQLIQELRR
ncbi:MAG: carbonic anhydrase [Planctomycetes bacterium]|jgi:carbonic anhydrase|nr:carbonic anhydrase [Planctomycetota bacterium]MCL4729374.1 carbonic anhydrase [Planctomycetota bacterium]